MDGYGKYHFPGPVLGSERPRGKTGIWRRRRVHAHADAEPGTHASPVDEPHTGSVGHAVGNPDSRAYTIGISESDPDAKSVDIYACDANSGAIGITESESVGTKPVGHADSEPIDDTVGNTGADTRDHAVDGSVDSSSAHTDSDPEHAAPAVPTAGNRRRRERCDR